MFFKLAKSRTKQVRPSFFGVTNSPFLVNDTITKHATKYEFDIDFMNKILHCFYVDDFTGAKKHFCKAFDLLEVCRTIFSFA